MQTLRPDKSGKYFQSVQKNLLDNIKTAVKIKEPDWDTVYDIVISRYSIQKSTLKSYVKAKIQGGRVTVTGRKLSVTSFGKPPGYTFSIGGRIKNIVTEQIYNDRNAEVLQKYFYAKFPNISGVHAFRRKGTSRYPVSLRLGPAVPQMLGSDAINNDVLEKIREIAVNNFEKSI
jgi:hypothetical protein